MGQKAIVADPGQLMATWGQMQLRAIAFPFKTPHDPENSNPCYFMGRSGDCSPASIPPRRMPLLRSSPLFSRLNPALKGNI
uniref:Uncharacterized protein n=1 Tax=Desertifilum tharense IPPAS B-1220 TaxID=1781255 RepID=A0ACD5GZF5_9CYAN